MTDDIQNQSGKELAERIKADLAETQHRFEISDPRTDATYRFHIAEDATDKAEELGATRFQGRSADGQVMQISKVDGEWKRSDGKSLDDIQSEIDKASIEAIKARAEQRASAGQGVDAETDKQMALADAFGFRRIQNPDLQDSAAEQITENIRANSNYKAFDAAVQIEENTAPGAVQIVAENENALRIPMQSMPGKMMIYNDQPGRRGVEVWHEDGSHIAFSNTGAIDRFAQENKLSPEDVQTLKELDSRKNSSPTNKPQENIIAINERSQEQDQTDKKKAKQGITQDIPDTVSNRYLRIEDKYYLPDKTVAFEDRGNKLKLETENHTVIRDALAIAETRGWQSISISGSQNFKHQVWREASLKGMEVAGYKPTEFEMAEVSQAITLRDASKEVGDNLKQQDGEMRGVLLAHGADHYKHDLKQGQSYYVKLDIDGKEVTRWGADLKRAFENSQSKPQVGDTVILSNIGQQSVDIPATALDDHGNVIEDKKTVKKNTWQVEKASYQDTLQEQAQALRVGNEIERKVIEQMPQLAAALAVSKLGEKIAQQAKETGALRSQDEVDTMVNLIREGLAAALEKGKHIKTPEIQEQGKHAAVDANSIINDHKPPQMVKEPQQQDMAMTR